MLEGNTMTTPHRLVLGIESSCDETAAAVIEDGLVVRSNVIASQNELHEEYGGVVPEIASRAHAEKILPVIRKAVTDAGVSLDDIDAVAVGNRPGLIGSLLVGVSAAKALAWSLGVPIVGVDHVHAHLYAGQLDATPAAFPALGLVVSGGHTSIYRCDSMININRLGSTIDDAMGEAFDKVAKMLALPYPGGPNVDRLAQEEGADDAAYAFPISRLKRDSLDFSFSGLKTAVLYAIRGVPKPGGVFERTVEDLSHEQRRDVAASFQRAAVEAIMLKLKRAVEQRFNHATGDIGHGGEPYQTLLVGGGVSANTLLRRRLTAFARQQNLALRLPELDHCVDNAAMIAGLGSALLEAGRQDDLTLTATPTTAC
jgi:tRNA N6-adenosine threonylcarbamoyltransferase